MLSKGETQTISHMSQAIGLMAELDVGTENWRWMGDVRFFLGFLRGLVAFRRCPVTLQIKVAEQDKLKMVEILRSKRSEDADIQSDSETIMERSVPPLTQVVGENDGWITVDRPMVYIYAGQGPYVGRDLMQFPVSLPNDGMIDIAIQELTRRVELLKGIAHAQIGQHFWSDSQLYFKATAYRVKTLTSEGYVVVDGEVFPFEDFQVEVCKGLGTLLSPYGHYADDLSTVT